MSDFQSISIFEKLISQLLKKISMKINGGASGFFGRNNKFIFKKNILVFIKYQAKTNLKLTLRYEL